MSEVTITIYETEADKRFRDATRGCAKPNHDSYLKWLQEGVDILAKNLETSSQPKGDVTVIKIQLPPSWMIHSAPGMTYAIMEMIFNGMMSDWYDGWDASVSKRYRQSAELNKAQLQSIINSLDN